MTRDEVIADDRRWFAGRHDREFRLRRAHPAEYNGVPPFGFSVFVVVNRMEIDMPFMHLMFGERSSFNTDLSDAEIRRLIAEKTETKR